MNDELQEAGGSSSQQSVSSFGDQDKSYTLFVGNLPPTTIQGDIDNIFSEVKQHIQRIRMIRDRDTDKFKGFCYVEFNDADAFNTALTFDNADYLGYALRVDCAAPKARDGGRGGGGFSQRNSGGQQDSYNNNNRGGGGAGYRNSPGAGYQNGATAGGYNNQRAPRYDQNRGSGAGGSYQQHQPQQGYDDRGGYGGGYNRSTGAGGGYNQGGYGAGGNYNRAGGNRDGYSNNRGYGSNNRYGGGQQQRSQDRSMHIEPVEFAQDRPRLNLKKREVNTPVATLADSEARSKIFGNALPREFKINQMKEGQQQEHQ